MTDQNSSNQISIYRSLFKGRDDVFAIHWEKGAKSGYMPAYYYDLYRYRAHKMKGGTFQNYTDKTYLRFTDEQLLRHLNGEQLIGLYPLLPDNTSWFIVADFDEQNWALACQKFIALCKQHNIPAYFERSRSGKGGHVWIFFEQPYPAFKSRKIILSLLTNSGIISPFDKNSGFDRLFPNQDTLSGKGLGNLIALPLHKPTLEQGNSCFIDPDSLQPFPNQWTFLAEIEKISVSKLDEVLHAVSTIEPTNAVTLGNGDSHELYISLNNTIQLNRSALPIQLVNFLKEELNFVNTEFIIKKKSGRNTFGTERYFKFVEETETSVILPRGFAGKLLRFCRETNITFEFNDERKKKLPINFQFNTALRDYQNAALTGSAKKDMGVIVAPPGSGKTIIGLKIIADKQQPALIVVHRKQLMDQWIERVQTFLSIPKHEIGKIGQGKFKIGKHITIATIQSLSKKLAKPGNTELKESFGTILIDECHHIPAESYRNTVQQFNSYYLYGLTATAFRKYNDGRLIFIHLGEIIAEIKTQDIGNFKQPKIIIRNTALDVPFNAKTDRFETLSKILIHDSARNKLILQDIIIELNAGKRVVVLTERKEHIDSLYQYLKQSYEVVTLCGDDSESDRTAKWKILKAGNYQALITTGQFFGEGTDLNNVTCLFLVYPFSFEGKLIQYIGRVQRSEIAPIIYDYRDIKIDYLNKLFLKRNTYYRKLEKQATLFDDPIEDGIEKKKVLVVDKEIKIGIETLEFRYGSISFKYKMTEVETELEFEIEHDDIRPEFEVLKPYFEKVLKSKNIVVSIYAEFENNQLVSQSAKSTDINKINKEMIDAVRFRFVTKSFLGKAIILPKENLLDINQLQSDKQLYESGEELLENLLSRKQFRHNKQLRYLAGNHVGNLLKIRFVLSPFSFVFLLERMEQFYIILETLDTEEATYLWHFDKNVTVLQSRLKEIDRQLDIIRNKGRQVFLASPLPNFSRILHDYANEQKGFIIWKDMLEERLV